MKPDSRLLDCLNDLLADELTAINQYMVHSEMCDDWGYARLHELVEKRAIDDTRHAEKLIGRILFLGGIPIVTHLKKIFIGAAVDKQLQNDRKSEEEAIAAYNKAIALARELGDHGTGDLFQTILKDEEAHIDLTQAKLDQIEQVGLQNFLAHQIREEE